MTLAGAGVPIDTVDISAEKLNGEPALVRRTYMRGATTEQIAAGDAIIAAFDWSAAAQQAWEDAQQPERAGLRDNAQAAVEAIDAYLQIADTATAAQVRQQVKALSQITRRVVTRLVQLSEGQ